jgi:hypothetical protein
VLPLKWSSLRFEYIGENEGEKVLTVALKIKDRKEKQYREARLVITALDLAALKNVVKPTTDDELVFQTDGVQERSSGEKMTRRQAAAVFVKAGRAAGVTKPVRPHCFRHARATELIRQGYNESVIKLMLWKNLNTKMFKVYVSLVAKDVDAEVYKKMGIKAMKEPLDEERQRLRSPRPCPVCGTQNVFDAQVCQKCGGPVSPEGIKAALAKKESEKTMDLDAITDLVEKKLAEYEAAHGKPVESHKVTPTASVGKIIPVPKKDKGEA